MSATRYLSIDHPMARHLDGFPNFSVTGSIRGMKKLYYGVDALLVRSGSYIYNVSRSELGRRIYEAAH